MHPSTRRTITHLAILFVACALCYFVGLTDHGVTNTQEATRLTAAREMQARADWILPTRQGDPYIAKPPVMYWIMIASAELRGARVDLFDVRFTVALGGLLGVFATYFAGRVLLRDPYQPALAPRAAFYGALGLAGGILYARSSRIGELDILMVPTVVTAMACIGAAWRSHVEHRKTLWWAVIVATLCSMIAALTKGPIPTAVIALGGFGAIVMESVFCDLPRSKIHTRIAQILAPLAAAATLFITLPQVENVKGVFGVAVHALVAGCLAWGLVRATEPARAKRWLSAFARTHPVVIVGAGFGALWWWIASYRVVAIREIGEQRMRELEQYEVQDNLRLLVPESPINNLEFLSYGLGAASIACLIALFWLARDKPRMTTGRWLCVGWLLLGLVLFSTMGKGVARYLTPLWPTVALLGGWWFACALRDIPRTAPGVRTWKVAAAGVLGISILANAWWYADGRDRFNADRSPRDFVRAMLEDDAIDPLRVGTFGFETPALDFYLGLDTHTGQQADYWAQDSKEDWRATPIERLFERLRDEPGAPPYHLIALDDTDDANRKFGDVRAMLDASGLAWSQTPVDGFPLWTRPPGSTPVTLITIMP
ncbi:MAG: hypothetical protein Tsb0013_15190 [Phycisphaerales bacterium]